VKSTRQLTVHNIDVFRETVNDATDRRAVEKRHRRPETALQDGRVEDGSRTQYALGQHERNQQHKDSCRHNTAKHIPIIFTIPVKNVVSSISVSIYQIKLS